MIIHPEVTTAYKDHAGALHERLSGALWENWKEAQRILRQACNQLTGNTHLPNEADALFSAVDDANRNAERLWNSYVAATAREHKEAGGE